MGDNLGNIRHLSGCSLQTYIDAVCSNPGTAGATLAVAITAGGPTADLAALGSTYMCGNSTDLAVEAANWGFPATSQDWQRAMK